MTDSTIATPTDAQERQRIWTEAGRGWGARAVEWAYLFEPYAQPANRLLFDQLEVTEGTEYLDVACGSNLIEIARARTPDGQLGLTYWGALDRMGLLPYFGKIIELSPKSHQAATIEMGETGNVAQAMLERTGFDGFCDAIAGFVTPLYSPATGVRISSEFGWVTATPS